ncbi:MAG: energy-coupling factor ABC transporter permease [bacterium]
MHIPDGFLAMNTWIPTWLISAAGIGYSIKAASQRLKEKFIPLMGVMSAFIFAAQMLNFPVAGGTSGHLLGGVMAAILLGPFSAAIVISVVLAVQCLVFQDGGITALGANILNMSIIGAMGGYLVYRLIYKLIRGNKGIIISAFVSAWFSVVIASAACSLELAISGTSPFSIVFPAMVGIHAIIGIGEGIITLLVISFIIRVRPDLIYGKEE